MRKTLGLRTMARPMATRWRWPPESALGLRSRYWVMSRVSAAARTLRSISSSGTFLRRRVKAMFSYTVMLG